ncbi:MAG: T9SS type A sorting domain-containing protein [Candidatus Marinimicrobia bacterium]|nr:T9SS type A sorting domain-containing protein [Candidatus Neomarinimicrobiota bacterium]
MNKIIFSGLLITILSGQETLWEANGIPIRQGVHIEWQRTVCNGDNGSAIFVWSDTRNGSRNIFAQKVNSSGNFLWGTDGVAVTDLPGRQEDPVAITDGNGGAYIAWVDYRFDDQGDIFIQHIDNNGNRLMVDDGESLARVDGRHLTINMCTDSSGGVFVAWQDKRNLLDDDIYGTHVSSSHDIVAPGTGVSIIEMNGNQGAKSLEYAGSGQATLLWSDTRSGAGNDIYGQKINIDMSKVFADEGLPIAVTSELETKPRTTYMSNDTSFVVWQSGAESSDIYFNFLTSNGLVFSDPHVISTFSSNKKGPRVKRNGMGDVFVQWTDFRSDTTNGNHYYQKITQGGVRAWSDDGIQLDNDGDDHNARFVGNAYGGAHIFWEQGTYPNVDIMYQEIQSAGTLANTTPIIISDADGYQSMPISVYDGAYGAYVIFADQENGSIDLRTQLAAGSVVQFEDNGLLVMEGLDGDVNFVSSNYNSNILTGNVLTWIDTRSRNKLYGNIVNINEPHFDFVNGMQLTDYEAYIWPIFQEPVSLFHSSGKVFSAVFDVSSGEKLIRISGFDENLTPLWGDSGIVVYDFLAEQNSPYLIELSESIGIIWSDFREGDGFDIFFQKYDFNGNNLLQEGGVKIVDGSWLDNYLESAFVTADGEILFIWVEDVWGSGSLKYNIINEDGSLAINGIPEGYVLDNSGDPENSRSEILPTNTGIITAWEEIHNFSKDIYGNIINWDGSLMHSSNVAITSLPNDQSKISLTVGEENALVVWEDFENGVEPDVSGRFVALDDFDLITDNIAICQADSFQGNPDLAYNENGHFIVVWEDGRGSAIEDPTLTGGLDIYLQILSENGIVLQDDGVAVASEYHNQSLPQLEQISITEGIENHKIWLLSWVDMRSSGKADLKNLYVQGIQVINVGIDDEVIPREFSVSSAYPNPFNGRVALDISIAEVEPIIFTIHNVLGQVVYQQTLLPTRAGKFQISWNGKNILQEELPSGIYLYSVKSNDNITSGKFTYLK